MTTESSEISFAHKKLDLKNGKSKKHQNNQKTSVTTRTNRTYVKPHPTLRGGLSLIKSDEDK